MDNQLFLHSCEIDDHFFAVSGLSDPISLRDQMLRAYVLAQRIPASWLQGDEEPVVVIGAGAAGVTFALSAARRIEASKNPRVNIWIVEKEAQSFSMQAKVPSRLIDPTQYDWPEDHWADKILPGIPMPLDFPRETADRLATHWRSILRREGITKDSSPVRLVTNTRVEIQGKHPNRVAWLIPSGGGGPLSVRAKLLVYAGGAGRERTCLESHGGEETGAVYRHFRSEGFWEEDDYESLIRNPPRIRATYPEGTPLIFVSGGSDGALQDFIRVATGLPSARHVVNELPPDASKRLAAGSRLACEQEWRHWAWGDDTGWCAAAKEAEDEMLDAIAQAYQVAGFSQALDKLLHGVSRTLRVSIAHPLLHFENRYPLNSLLALMLLEHARRREYKISRLRLTRLVHVKGLGHTCKHNPEECKRFVHFVRVESALGEPETRCPPADNGTRDAKYFAVDRLIIRHGLQGRPLWATSVPHRQMPPYYLGRRHNGAPLMPTAVSG